VKYTDNEIIIALQDSDEQVFETIFRFYYQGLCNYANRLLNDADEAEDAVQLLFIRIWEKREKISINYSFKAYLYKSVHNACLNKIKQLEMKKAHHSKENTVSQTSKSNADQNLFAKELERHIALAIEGLPEQCRIIFKLSRFEELKYAEIAGQLNLSIKTVEHQMGKALRVLREKLKDYLPQLLFLLTYLSI